MDIVYIVHVYVNLMEAKPIENNGDDVMKSCTYLNGM